MIRKNIKKGDFVRNNFDDCETNKWIGLVIEVKPHIAKIYYSQWPATIWIPFDCLESISDDKSKLNKLLTKHEK